MGSLCVCVGVFVCMCVCMPRNCFSVSQQKLDIFHFLLWRVWGDGEGARLSPWKLCLFLIPLLSSISGRKPIRTHTDATFLQRGELLKLSWRGPIGLLNSGSERLLTVSPLNTEPSRWLLNLCTVHTQSLCEGQISTRVKWHDITAPYCSWSLDKLTKSHALCEL